MELFKLFGSIVVDNSKANESIKDTDSKTEGLGKKFVEGVGTAAKWSMGIAAGAAAGATALFEVAKKAGETTSEIKDMADRTGESAEEYQKLTYAANMSGMSAEGLEKALTKQQTSFAKAKEGNKGLSDTYSKLGIDISKIGNSSDAFNAVIGKLADMKDETQRNAIASQLFGKSYADLNPLLKEGSSGIEELKQKAVDLGLVMSNDSVSAGENFGDTLETVQKSFGALTTKIGVEVIPIVQTFLNWILDNMPTIQTVVGAVFNGISIVVTTVGGILQSVFSAISQAVSGSGITFQDVMGVIQTVFNGAMTVLQTLWNTIGLPVFNFIQAVVGTVAQYFIDRFPQIQVAVSSVFSDIQSIWENNLKPCFTAIGNFINNVLAPAFKFVFQNIIAPIVDSVFRGIGQLWENSLKPIFTNIIDFVKNVFTGNFSGAFQNIINIVKGIWNGIIDIVKTPINAVIGIINKFINGLNKLKVPSWVPLIGGKGIDIPDIPLLATGGTVLSAGKAIVGEAGAEMIDLPAGAKVTPLTNGKGSMLGSDKMEQLLTLILAELKELRSSLYDTVVKALVDGVEIDWSDRELARLVRKYA